MHTHKLTHHKLTHRTHILIQTNIRAHIKGYLLGVLCSPCAVKLTDTVRCWRVTYVRRGRWAPCLPVRFAVVFTPYTPADRCARRAAEPLDAQERDSRAVQTGLLHDCKPRLPPSTTHPPSLSPGSLTLHVPAALHDALFARGPKPVF